MATPRVTLSHDKRPLGSPIDITYKFVVAPRREVHRGLPRHGPRRRPDEELMWTDDHDPPMPTTQWKPGQTIEYTRTVFVPIYPYVGEATIQLGLYSTTTQKPRLPLTGDDAGQRAYKVATAAAAAAERERVHGLQGRLAPGESAEHNAIGRVAVDEEGGDAGVQESRRRTASSTWNWTTPAASSTSRSRSR